MRVEPLYQFSFSEVRFLFSPRSHQIHAQSLPKLVPLVFGFFEVTVVLHRVLVAPS